MPDTSRIAAALADRYVIEREIGAGGMATVYLARDVKHDRDVALKILRADLSAVLGGERFLNEVRITARLDHPHILTLIDSGEADGVLYYVLPYVRGESLRAKLEREKQLGLEEALSIIRQIAGALDYAHQHGVVHRDIKPENILLHEGEAMLADFGIALAVKEAGGNRLTETGLSLGTPQYMSPEQATGDRALDARSDVYSLAAVLYEMLAGEPPVTGPTVQAVIAKLITERPTRLRVVRDTVPEGIDAAVAKALSKVPADRFASAGEMMRAIAVSGGGSAGPRRRPFPPALVGGALVVVLLAGAGWALFGKSGGTPGDAYVLRERTQLTSTARIRLPAISPDGKQLAYGTQECRGGSCTWGVDVQDVGGTEIRRLFTGLTALYAMLWSDDRRNLLVTGTIEGRYGSWLLSTLGGRPRFIHSSGAATFLGDSLIFPPVAASDSAFYLRVSGLDGVPRDSLRLPGRVTIAFAMAVPASRWIATTAFRGPTTVLLLHDRHGRIADSLDLHTSGATIQVSRAAVWLRTDNLAQGRGPITRLAVDTVRGRFAAHADTLYTGTAASFSVPADGSALVLEEGTSRYDVWAVDFAAAQRGTLAERDRIAQSSTPTVGSISRDGRYVLFVGDAATASRATIRELASGRETNVPLDGRITGGFWADSAIALREARPDGREQLSLVSVAGRRSAAFPIPEVFTDFAPWAGGWAWVTSDGLTIKVQPGGATQAQSFRVSAWYLFMVDIAVRGERMAYIGWNVSTADSLGLSVREVDGTTTPWFTTFAEGGYLRWLADGSILLGVAENQDLWTLYRVAGPGRVTRLARIPRAIRGITVSDDLRRAVINTREYFGDAWLNRVARR